MAIDSSLNQGHPRYEQLLERAVDYIDAQGGAVSEEQLITYVFGASSAPELWRGLLRSILSAEPRLRQRPDTSWAIRMPNPEQAADFPSEYVVLDVETTGLKPRQHRITEVALICVAPNDQTMRWSSLINPERRIPKYVKELTGIDDQKVASAPSFRTVAQTVIDLIGDRLVIGHNVEFDISFLNAELKRCGLPGLLNHQLDTMTIADALVDSLRRLDLASVAKSLDVASQTAHRALADAETTLAIFDRLRGRANEQGLGSFDSLANLSTRRNGSRKPRRRPVNANARGRALLDRSYLDQIPHAPGVYIMRDDQERVIYVGKAKDLRKRVGSYYSQPLGYTRKMDGLLEALATIETVVVGSELEALLLESQLIRRYGPRFNKAQRNVEQYSYIKIDVTNPWPRVTLAKDRKDDDARYFGPFRSGRQIRDAVRLINDILPLRTCKRSFRNSRSYGSPCIELSLRRCLGPCTGSANREVYRKHVNDVIAFFAGAREPLIALLHARLESTVAHLDYERAAKLRDQMARLERLSLEQVNLDDAATTGHALLVLPGPMEDAREVCYLLHGRRWAQIQIGSETSVKNLAARLDDVRSRACRSRFAMYPDHYSVDETSLVWRWIRRNPEHPAFIPWNNGRAATDVAQQILDLDMTAPFGEHGAETETSVSE